MGELLALASALCFGLTHFVNGVLSRRAPGLTISLYAQLGGTAITLLAALCWPDGTGAGLGWGALSGLGTGIGVAFLYRAMSTGALSVVVPVSDVGAVAIPVLIGLVFLSERPSALAIAGVVLALPAIWLVSGGSGRATGLRDALIAGAGFAVQFLGMAPVPVDAGLWPIVLSRVVSVAVILPLVLGTRTPVRLRPSVAAPALIAGAVGSVAIVLYWVAAHRQLVALATVLAALYPAIPVVLGVVLLRERLRGTQILGVLGAGLAVACIALG
ncbi:EamA family transporter [Amycolatopsis sp.]|uniref:EamA family transporter n=1 Tax=Amycolatopsis sp. TaxID=37632 RepID=UPI002CC59188|nr:EamA family transporter [Amycolatopsis sp.]HVV10338.1 EamA family transporter [Amycolatopsis sp.]